MNKIQAIESAMYKLRQAGYNINDKFYQALVAEKARLEKKSLSNIDKRFQEDMIGEYPDMNDFFE